MGAQVVDYRVSTLVVLCKDCGNDVGLYPARHKCTPIDRPAMPTLPAQYKKSNPPGTLDLNSKNLSSFSMTSSPSSSSNESPSTPSSKWSSSRTTPVVEDNDDSVYFNNFAANLPEKNEPSGKKLWGKVRQNDKWKQLNEKNEKPKQSGKLWGKLLQATQTMADKIPSRDDRGAESDEDDWEGETHVARILREYYEKKNLPLPDWLFDDNMVQRKKSITNKGRNDQLDVNSNTTTPIRTPSRRRLWEQDQDDKKISSRERERQELRQAKEREDRYSHDNRYTQKKDEYQYRDEDRYYQRDDDNRYHQRDNDRYHQRDEDRYRQRENDRYRPREEERYHQREEDRYRPREEDRYHHSTNSDNHYKHTYATKEEDYYRGYNNESPKQSRHFEEERSYIRPLSPQQRVNSTSRQRAFEDSNDYQPIRSGRSIRGYKDSSRVDRYENTGGYDHYSSTSRQVPQASKERSYQYSTESRRERRYVNENNYF